jgi:hypothetical protein
LAVGQFEFGASFRIATPPSLSRERGSGIDWLDSRFRGNDPDRAITRAISN